jgi:hypothetical protein
MSRLKGVRGRIGPLLLAGVIWAGVGSSGVLATPSGPANDSFVNAIALSGVDTSRSGDTNVGATLEPGEDTSVAAQPAGASVWYTWTAPMTGVVVIDTATSGFDTMLGVYTGTAVNALGEVASNDDFYGTSTPSRVRFAATNGTVYRIRVDGYSGLSEPATGTINLNLHQAAPPANDDFANAIALASSSTVSQSGSNDGATLQSGEEDTVAGFAAGSSVWYSWTAPANGDVAIDTATSNFDTLVGVYTGSAVGALTTVTSNDDAKFPPTSLVRFSATSGTVYRIRVDGYRQASGAIALHLNEVPHATSPANDFFADAVVLPSVMSTSRTSDTNAGATPESGETPSIAGEPATNSVWYRWTAPGPGTVTIDTATSDFDTFVGVYTGTSVSTLTDVASNDDVGKTDLTSSARFQATAGTVYRIRVDGYAGDTGAITLHLNENLPPANDNFANAFILSGDDDARLGDTNVAATRQTGEATTVAGQPASTSVWYFWTAPDTSAVTIDTATSDFDTLLGVYTGNAVNSLAAVASNDNVGTSDHTSKVAFAAIEGTSYWIRVDGLSGATGTIKLHIALATVSTVPINVTATPGDQQATVSWTAPASDGGSPITGYDVTRYTAGAAPVTTQVGAVTQATVSGLTNGTTYTFRIAATNAIGTGAQSADSNPVTPRTVPDAPTTVTATPGIAQATVHWTAPASNGGSAITGYDVTRYVAGVAQGTTSVGAVTQTTVGGLTNGTAYTFKVAAKNVAGTGAQSPASNAVTPWPAPDPPTGVSATPGAGQATVNWTAPAFDGGSPIIGYDVTRYSAGIAQGTTSVGLVTSTTIGGLTNGTAYTFKVAAKNIAGTGAQSAASNPVTPRTVPDAPTGLSGTTGGSGQAVLSWSAPAFDGGAAISGYDVTAYSGGVAQSTTAVGAATQATIGGLTNGATYTFRIAAKNVAGTGAQSSDSNAVTPRTVPDAPASVSASTGGAGQAIVNWSTPAFNGGAPITGYEVTSYVAGAVRTKITVGLGNQVTFGGLTNGTTYTFRVAAKNVAGTGAQSADTNGVTPAALKLTLTVAKSGSGAGTVTSSVGTISCGATCSASFDEGTLVTLTALASGGSAFAGWSGPCTGIGSCTVGIDTAKTVTARFDELASPGQQQTSKCVVPNVKRKPLATAKRKIAAAHCKTGKVTKAPSKTVPKGQVVSVKPSAGKKLAAGSKVKLVVSRGKR